MSKRTIIIDPSEAREAAYKKMDSDGLAAVWEAIQTLSDNGIEIGPKCTKMLEIRSEIKAKAPKS
jgi:hypothetical protein